MLAEGIMNIEFLFRVIGLMCSYGVAAVVAILVLLVAQANLFVAK